MPAASEHSDSSFSSYLAFAHELADLAADAILPLFRRHGPVDNKSQVGAFDPVTEADRAAEQVVREAIAERWPDHGIDGEEFGDTNPDADYRWIIDPIDGTRAFIMGMPMWGTLIGLAHRGRMVLGMMHQPFTGERFWNGEDGARYRGPDGERAIETRACAALAEATLTSTSPDLFATADDKARFEALAEDVKMRRFGGDCYAYCLLAAGHVDLIVESGLKPYDVAPLIPIVEAAGGRITSWDGGDPAAGGQVLASGDPALHDEALRHLAG